MLKKYIGIILVGIFGFCRNVNGENIHCLESEIALKKPGNAAVVFPLNSAPGGGRDKSGALEGDGFYSGRNCAAGRREFRYPEIDSDPDG